MKHRRGLVCAIFLFVSVAWTQQAATSEVSASREDILRLFDVMHLRDQMKLVMSQLSAQMKSISHDQLRKRNPQITDDEFAKLDAMSDELIKAIPIDGMLDDMIPVYQKHLSTLDVDAMVVFYSSSAGQKILREMPAITAEGMQALQPRLRKVMDEDVEKLEKVAQQEQEQKQPVK